jgi:glycosyltransferase involved in cell wall biosynthesis
MESKSCMNMKILIASGAGGGTAKGRIGKHIHLKDFGEALVRKGVEYKLVYENDYVSGFPSKNIKSWFSKKKFYNLINDFKPDVVFVDRQSHFGLESIKLKIPTYVYLRGNYWSEVEWAKKTVYKSFLMRWVLDQRKKIANTVFEKCNGIFMTADYLDKIIKKQIPNAKTLHFLEGLDTSRWYPQEGMKLQHPCVGMLHDANWWGKTKEMLVLENVIKEMPNVHFYWAGDGQYKGPILEKLNQFENFHYLENLEYPDKVREYLTEIDIYALPTGMDTTPLSCREAMSMKNPVVASKVGGIPEMVFDNKTGFLVNEGDYKGWIEKLTILVNDPDLRKKFGAEGKNTVLEIFNWDKLAEEFINIVSKK